MGGADAPPANTTSETKQQPWDGAARFLTNGNASYDPQSGMFMQTGGGPMGIYEQTANFANKYKNIGPEEAWANDLYDKELRLRTLAQGVNKDQFVGYGNNLASGAYNTNFGPVGQSSLTNARASQGALDPTNAMQQLLSGHPDNPYLQAMHQANINTSMRGYNDALQNAAQTIYPSIDEQAFASGQYGGSRQGIAEGLAGQQLLRNARDLGIAAMDSGNNLYGGAYENAQNRMASAASELNQQAAQNEQFNTNVDFQNNQQALSQAQNNVQNMLNGVELQQKAYTDYWSGLDQDFAALKNLYTSPMSRELDMLSTLIGTIQPGASLGRSSSSTESQPYYSSTIGQNIGAAADVAGLLSQLGRK